MDKIFNLITAFKSAHEDDDEGVVIKGMASTSDEDRMGDIIVPEAWKRGGLDNFKKNPIVLFNHKHDNPIGKATDLAVTKKGLEIEAKISRAATNNVVGLIKDGVLGAFSVGFMIKDADFIEETGGLMIKDVELFEVSVVSVPMNQDATFSLAKSFDSNKEYEDFKKTFTNSEDLAGQSLATREAIASKIARNAPDGAPSGAQKEIKMDEAQKLEMEQIAKKAAEGAAIKVAMQLAKDTAKAVARQKEVDDAAKARRLAVDTEVSAAVTTNTEKLLADFAEKMGEKDVDIADQVAKFAADLKEKEKELEKMRDSRRVFTSRKEAKEDIGKWGKDFLSAHMLGVITGKGMDTDFAKELQEKAGIDYITNAPDIDQEVSNRIEKEITVNLKVAKLFREFPVNGAATVLPIQPDTGLADWVINATSGNLENRGASNNTYQPKQVILNAYRLVSSTYMDNNVDEQVLINLMPMLIDGVARAHARTVERTIILGDEKSSSNISGLTQFALDHSVQIDLDATSIAVGDSAVMTADILLGARQVMGKYGVNPGDLAYIVSQNSYYDLLSDAKFQTLDEVGSDLAVRVVGSLGAVYGTPVIVSDEFATEAAGVAAAFVVHTHNYIIPRLRGVLVERDYEVMNQRQIIVASQALGFEEILAGDGSGTEPSVKITFTA